ncbi:hypothetical protein [Lysinibacillus fusiformis]|uniref:hypothetical protein n=1 Tax=Lysinibacillus fusiformis TaxID=28031 RepID=UPI00355628F2
MLKTTLKKTVINANIVWFVPIVVGAIIVAGGIIFSALYFSHKEKMTLIDKCYANGGYPEIDSKDKAGAKGTTDVELQLKQVDINLNVRKRSEAGT